MGFMGSLSPPSSSITSDSINLDLTLSICRSSPQTTLLPEKIEKTRDGDKKSITLFGFTFSVDHIVPETPMHTVMNNPIDVEQVTRIYEKELTTSDVGSCCRLMIKKQFVIDNVIPYLNEVERGEVHSDAGYHVEVVDVDTRTEHALNFKFWKSSNSYVFTEWSKSFLKRRNLKKDD